MSLINVALGVLRAQFSVNVEHSEGQRPKYLRMPVLNSILFTIAT